MAKVFGWAPKIKITEDIPMRIQFVNENILQAEVIVQSFEIAREVSARYAQVKYRRNSDDGSVVSAGGTIIYRADQERIFNVPVGTRIK